MDEKKHPYAYAHYPRHCHRSHSFTVTRGITGALGVWHFCAPSLLQLQLSCGFWTVASVAWNESPTFRRLVRFLIHSDCIDMGNCCLAPFQITSSGQIQSASAGWERKNSSTTLHAVSLILTSRSRMPRSRASISLTQVAKLPVESTGVFYEHLSPS